MANGDNPPRFYDLGPFRLDAVKFLLLRGGNLVAVSPKATQILALLVRRRGELVEKQDILDAVWKNVAVEEGVIAHYVSELRRVLRDASNGDRWIETVPSRGYRFVGPARPVPDPAGRLEDAVGKRAEIIESPHSEFEGLAYKFRRVAVLLPYHLGFVGLIVGLLLLGLRIKYPPEPRVLNVRPITHDGFDKKWIAPVIVGDQAYFTEIAQSYRVMRVPLRGGESEPVPALDGLVCGKLPPMARRYLRAKAPLPTTSFGFCQRQEGRAASWGWTAMNPHGRRTVPASYIAMRPVYGWSAKTAKVPSLCQPLGASSSVRSGHRMASLSVLRPATTINMIQ